MPTGTHLLDTADFAMVQKRNGINESNQSSSSANDTTNSIPNTSVVSTTSFDGKYFTPRQLYKMKKPNNKTI
jgi:hypothetical protein